MGAAASRLPCALRAVDNCRAHCRGATHEKEFATARAVVTGGGILLGDGTLKPHRFRARTIL
jgi:hypothetical protein